MSSLTISLIQSSLHWEDKTANLSMFEEKIRSIAEKTEIILLPEMFSTGFSMEPARLGENMNGPTVSWMKKMAAEKKAVLAGSIIAEEEGKYFNRLVWALPTGETGWYDKRHLFAFAGEDKCYKAGKKRFIASVNGWKINVLVCYDLRFPVWARQSGSGDEYDLLICVANWPERRIHAWKTLLVARAIENQCFVAGLNRVGSDGNQIEYNGDSMIVDPLGQVLYQSEREEVYTFTLHKQKLTEVRERFPFLRDADHFLIET